MHGLVHQGHINSVEMRAKEQGFSKNKAPKAVFVGRRTETGFSMDFYMDSFTLS